MASLVIDNLSRESFKKAVKDLVVWVHKREHRQSATGDALDVCTLIKYLQNRGYTFTSAELVGILAELTDVLDLEVQDLEVQYGTRFIFRFK